MTVSLAWIRVLRGGTEELVFASDSRLRGGYAWDTAQKIFPLAGINAVLSFAGDTALALPVIDQIVASCENYPQARSGATDVAELRTHILNILNSMRNRFVAAAPAEVKSMDRQTIFLFGGYSHAHGELLLWRLWFDPTVKRFWHEPPRAWHHESRWSRLKDWRRTRKYFCFAGDCYHEFKAHLSRVIQAGRGNVPSFDMEPLQALVSMLKTQTADGLIGGAPQMVKVYPSRTYLPFAVRWGDGNGVHLYGRPLLAYEKTLYPVLDPESLSVFYPLEDIKN